MNLVDSSTMLEREAEFDRAGRMIELVCAGIGGALLLEGPAGIGKTALLSGVIDRAQQAGMTVLRARGSALRTRFPWGVVRELYVGPLHGLDPPSRAQVLSEAAGLAAHALGYETTEPGTEEVSFSAIHGLYWLTSNLSERAPVLIAVDDLHWADAVSLRFLLHLIGRLEGLAVMVLCAARPLESEPDVETSLLARIALEPALATLRPAALSPVACSVVVRDELGAETPTPVCSVCHEMTGGNPFLLRALLAALVMDRPSGTEELLALVRRMKPDIVSRSVLVRMATMPPGSLAFARAVAVLDGEADPRRAGALAGLDHRQAADALMFLARGEILIETDGLRYVHPLVRAAVYNDLTPSERGEWHRRAAWLLAEERQGVAAVAVHLLAAAPQADAWTVEQLRAAAGQAREHGASEVAIVYLERALAEGAGDEQRAELLFDLGWTHSLRAPNAACPGDTEIAGVAQMSEALALTGDPRRRAEMALRLGTTLGLAGAHARAVQILQQGLLEDGQDPALRLHLEAELAGHCLHTAAELARGYELLGRVAGGPVPSDPSEHLLHAIAAFAAIAAARITPRRAIEIARAAARGRADELAGAESSSLNFFVAETLIYAEDLDGAIDVLDDMIAHARRRGAPRRVALASAFRAQAALRRGDVLEAEADGRTALEAIDSNALSYCRPYVLSFLIDALIERGELDESERLLAAEPPPEQWPALWQYGLLLGTRGRLAMAQGRFEQAAADLLEWGRCVAPWIPRNPASVTWRSDAALALAALGDDDQARRLARWELGHARELGAGRSLGVALRVAGVVSGGEQRGELLNEAVAVLQRARAPLEHARALAELGAAQRRAGQRALARTTLAQALDLALRCGGIAVADRARAELRIAGARPRRDALRGRDALTASELRIAQLAATGRTNREIAQDLFVTLRTVEIHLTHCYAKLGISSRRQLAQTLAASPASG